MRSTIPSSIVIRESMSNENGRILADATLLNQILLNLCTNAAQAMGEIGGVLEVSLSIVTINKKILFDRNTDSDDFIS